MAAVRGRTAASRRAGDSRVAVICGRAASARLAFQITAPSPAVDIRPAPASSSLRRGRSGPGSARRFKLCAAPSAPASLTMPAGTGDRPPAGGCSPSAAAGLPSASAVQPGTTGTTAPPGRESAQLCRTHPAVAARHAGQTSPSQPPPHLSFTPANSEDGHDALIHCPCASPLWKPRRGKTLTSRNRLCDLDGHHHVPGKAHTRTFRRYGKGHKPESGLPQRAQNQQSGAALSSPSGH
jgi:hypothetical protein